MVETAIGRFGPVITDKAVGDPVTLLIKPDAVSGIVPAHAEPLESNQLQGKIAAYSFRGRYTQVWVESGGLQLQFESRPMPNFALATPVNMSLNPDGIIVLSL
jgi:hypothetical protein